jgi:hypothetical protein
MRIHIQKMVALLLAPALTLAVVGSVAAQDGEIPPPPCEGEGVSGTVVAVDEEGGIVTVDTGDGWCTVTLDGEYDHPIVALLGSYFGDVSAGSLAEALDTTQGCAVHDPDSDTWTWADCSDEDAVPVTVVAENEDGTFTVTATVGGEEVTGTVTVDDPETAERLSEALQALAVGWDLDGEGGVVQPGDEIAAYHEDGLGFGVLVKLYAMAAASQQECEDEESPEPCGVTVAELVEAFQSGTGMGELFKDYVRPFVRGIGHVRGKGGGRPEHAGPKDRADWPDDDDADDDDDDLGSLDRAGRPDHAGPKDKDKDKGNGGPPAHAGPKDKDKDKDNGGPPAHAGPKKPKKGK